MALKEGIRKQCIKDLYEATGYIRSLRNACSALGFESMAEELDTSYRLVANAKDNLEYGD